MTLHIMFPLSMIYVMLLGMNELRKMGNSESMNKTQGIKRNC